MKKQILILLLAFIVCHGLQAQNTGELNCFNLVLPDNSLVRFELANGIDIHFQDSVMVVNDLSFFMEDNVKYYFSGNYDVEENENDHSSYVVDNKLFVKSNGEGYIVISDVLGRVVYSKPNCKECVIDLSRLALNTLYVIKVNNQSIKFVRK